MQKTPCVRRRGPWPRRARGRLPGSPRALPPGEPVRPAAATARYRVAASADRPCLPGHGGTARPPPPTIGAPFRCAGCSPAEAVTGARRAKARSSRRRPPALRPTPPGAASARSAAVRRAPSSLADRPARTARTGRARCPAHTPRPHLFGTQRRPGECITSLLTRGVRTDECVDSADHGLADLARVGVGGYRLTVVGQQDGRGKEVVDGRTQVVRVQEPMSTTSVMRSASASAG